mgnify:CR=1 FL=1
MKENKSMMKPFGFLKKKVEKDPMTPKYIKPDGTKVIEQESPLGTTVYEICPDGAVIAMTYDKSDKLILDWIRRTNLEIGRTYDEYGNIIAEFNSLYDKGNVLAKTIQKEYEYYDNGVKSKEISVELPGEIKTETLFDEQGVQTQKIEYRGSVKTYFDKDNKPFKREIDRGSGGIITENIE